MFKRKRVGDIHDTQNKRKCKLKVNFARLCGHAWKCILVAETRLLKLFIYWIGTPISVA